MKCSTETLQTIQRLMVEDYMHQMEAAGNKNTSEIEQSLRQDLKAVGQASLGQLLSKLDEQRYSVKESCECQSQGRRTSRRSAQVLSVFGWVKYSRSYYGCRVCGRRWVPLDQAQQLRPGRATELMSRLLGLAGISVSFEEAQRHILEYLQVAVSSNTIREATQLIGARQALREAEWVQASQDPSYLQSCEQKSERPKRRYGSIDGAFVPLEEEWKEAKLICWYQVGFRYDRPEPCALEPRYHVSLEDASAFGQLLWGTAVVSQANRAEELIFVCDGAVWIWRLVSHYFPEAIQIVDWHHACQYLFPVADALFSSEAEQQAWLAEMKELLWEGQVETILRRCQDLPARASEPANKLLSYYSNNQERMRYAQFRQAGYFIGSGTVESGCKQVITSRLKLAGAHWKKTGAAYTAKARSAWLNQDWDAVTCLPLAV